MSILFDFIAVPVVILMAIFSIIEAFKYRREKKTDQNSLKKALFRYSISNSNENLVNLFMHSKKEMEMVNKGNDLCDQEPDFKYFDYFINLRKEGNNDQND